MLTHPDSQQPVDLGLDLRRRRYGTSHGVGLLHCLGGREGTYAVALTAPADLQQLEDAARFCRFTPCYRGISRAGGDTPQHAKPGPTEAQPLRPAAGLVVVGSGAG